MLLLPWYNTGCHSDEMGFFVNHFWDWLNHAFQRIWTEMEKRKKSWLYNIARHMGLLHFVVMITISSGVFLEIYVMKNPSSPYKN